MQLPWYMPALRLARMLICVVMLRLELDSITPQDYLAVVCRFDLLRYHLSGLKQHLSICKRRVVICRPGLLERFSAICTSHGDRP